MTVPTPPADGPNDFTDYDLFTQNFGEWLEEHGVKILDVDRVPFIATIDLNELKRAIMFLQAAKEDRS